MLIFSFRQLGNITLWKKITWHFAAWLIYIVYEMLYLYLMSRSMTNLSSYALNYALNISLFYFNAFILLDYFKGKLNWSWPVVVFLIAIEVVVFLTIKYPINLMFYGSEVELNNYEEWRVYLVANSLRSFYFIGFSTLYWLSLLTINRNQRIAELETTRLQSENEKILLQKDLLQARNAYLQAQINPHLLFNTLNFMYNASSKVSEKLSDAVMTLSDIMEFALSSVGDDDRVPLEKEICHIHNLIHLNQLRFDEKLQVDFEVIGESDGLRIIPLALITIIENVFKYGDLHDANYPAVIKITLLKSALRLDVSNKKRPGSHIRGHGSGINNLRERLEHHYSGLYSLTIDESVESYLLKLNLNLNENEP